MGPTALVTGATGSVGPYVVQAMQHAGYRVRVLSRRVPLAGLLPEDVEVCLGDVTDPAAVQSAMRGAKVVLHLAALLHIINPPLALCEQYTQINVGGTTAVVQAATQAGVQRLVFFSTIAVYGPTAGQIVTEDSTPCPDSYYAQTKLAAERVVLGAKRPDGQPLGTVLRLGAVYGARVKGNYQRLVRSLARHRFIAIGDGQNRRTVLYEQDVARVAVLAAQHQDAGGQVYNVSDGQYHSMRAIITAICVALGRTLPCWALPVGPVRVMAGCVEDMARCMGLQAPVARATVDKYTEDMAVSSQRIQKHLGFVPLFDLDAGWRATVLAMRRMGAL